MALPIVATRPYRATYRHDDGSVLWINDYPAFDEAIADLRRTRRRLRSGSGQVVLDGVGFVGGVDARGVHEAPYAREVDR